MVGGAENAGVRYGTVRLVAWHAWHAGLTWRGMMGHGTYRYELMHLRLLRLRWLIGVRRGHGVQHRPPSTPQRRAVLWAAVLFPHRGYDSFTCPRTRCAGATLQQ
jgi:hypothetical protein